MPRNACFAFALLAVAFAPFATAQSITGDLVVDVYDSSGGIVAGAHLLLTEVQTGIKQDSVTDADGKELFSQLKPGRYRLSVSAPGFQNKEVTDVQIHVGQRARVQVDLTVGQVTEAVTVSAAGVTLLNSESAAIGQVLEQQAIVDLPLSGRNFIQLAAIRRARYRSGSGPLRLPVGPDAAT